MRKQASAVWASAMIVRRRGPRKGGPQAGDPKQGCRWTITWAICIVDANTPNHSAYAAQAKLIDKFLCAFTVFGRYNF